MLLLKNSVLVSLLATVLAVGIGLAVALWLAGLPRRWRALFLVLAVIALATPPFVATNCWLHFLGDTGAWRRWVPLNIFSLGGAAWILALLLWPIATFAACAAWQRLEPAQLESDMAVTGWNLLRGLLVPLARNAIVIAATLTFVLALNNFAVPAILQVKVFPAEMWVRFNTTFDTWGVLLMSLPLVLGPLLLFLLLNLNRNLSLNLNPSSIPWPHVQPTVSPRLIRRQLGPALFWTSGVIALTTCLFAVGLPVLQLILVKRTWTELPGALAAARGQHALGHSFWFAASAATAVILSALFVQPARSVRRLHPPLSHSPTLPFFRLLLWLPFLLPGVLTGLALIHLFNHSWTSFFYQSAGIVILAFVIRYLALGWTAVASATASVDRDLADAARLEGASRLQMFRHAYWPQTGPQLAAAWYIIFLLCLWDVETMILVVPPGGETLSLRIFNLLHYGHNAQVNALCLALLALALAPLIAWTVVSKVRPGVGGRGARGKPVHSPPSTVQGPKAEIGSHFTIHVSCFTHHALTLLTLLTLPLTSCSPSSPASTPLGSRLFSRVEVIGSRGVGVGQFNKPRSVAIDREDNLYVADMTGRVQKFSSSGAFLLSWQMPQTDLGKPKGMCRDSDGNIIVLEPHYQRVNHFSPDGKLVAQWGQRGTGPGQFMLPRAVAVNSRGEMFVSEYGENERVQKFDLQTTKVTKDTKSPEQASANTQHAIRNTQHVSPPSPAPRPSPLLSLGHPGTGPGEFNRAEGICVDSEDRLYVADSCNHRIQIFSSDGKFLRAYGKAGAGKGELSYPYDICVDSSGRQYICEFGNGRIQIFDANDQPIEIIGHPGAEPGEFSNPWGIALDSAGNLYVADSQNHRVQKLIRRQNASAQSRAREQAASREQASIAPHVAAEVTRLCYFLTQQAEKNWSLVISAATNRGSLRPRPSTLDARPFGFRASDFGLRTLDFGLWTLDRAP
ncbi:MAG: hypothetical protein C5B50_14790 [Verrucomicrobia bacterium]|nr:MAG: hypothetical protein C5B50_14790 [Verrucomicrobiota bacterium]